MKNLIAHEQGNRAFRAGHYVAAISAYTSIIDSNEADDVQVAQCNRSACFLKIGKFDLAEADARAALDKSTNFPKAHFRLAQALIKLHGIKNFSASHNEQPSVVAPASADAQLLKHMQDNPFNKSLRETKRRAAQEINACIQALFIAGNEDGAKQILKEAQAAFPNEKFDSTEQMSELEIFIAKNECEAASRFIFKRQLLGKLLVIRCNHNSFNLLHLAIQQNYLQAAVMLLNLEPKLNAVTSDSYQKTPMYMAVEQNNIEIILLLLQSDNPMISVKSSNGKSALDLALQGKNIEVLKLFYSHVSTAAAAAADSTALQFEISSVLFQFDSSIILQDASHMNNCARLAFESSNFQLFKSFVSTGNVSLNKYFSFKNQGLDSYLYFAVTELKSVEWCEFLIKSGATISSNVFVKAACSVENEALIKMLVKYGANINAKATRDFIAGKTALICAAEHNCKSIVTFLIHQYASINESQHNSALMYAVKNNHYEIARDLIRAGAFVNYKNPFENSCALSIAVEQANIQMTRLLLKEGCANPNIAYGYNGEYTPLNEAIKSSSSFVDQQMEIIKLIVESNSKAVNFECNEQTPLYCAISQMKWYIVTYLLEKGAKLYHPHISKLFSCIDANVPREVLTKMFDHGLKYEYTNLKRKDYKIMTLKMENNNIELTSVIVLGVDNIKAILQNVYKIPRDARITVKFPGKKTFEEFAKLYETPTYAWNAIVELIFKWTTQPLYNGKTIQKYLGFATDLIIFTKK